MSILAYQNGQNIVYRQYRPHLTLIADDETPKIVGVPLMLILKMGPGACGFLSWQYRQPVCRFWIAMIKSHFNYLTYKT